MSFPDHPGFTSRAGQQIQALSSFTEEQLKAVAADFDLAPEVVATAKRYLRSIRRAAKGLPFAWDIEVEFSKAMIYTAGYPGNWKKTFHYKECSEAQARKRALIRVHARAVTRVDRIETEDQYRRAYGNWEEKGL